MAIAKYDEMMFALVPCLLWLLHVKIHTQTEKPTLMKSRHYLTLYAAACLLGCSTTTTSPTVSSPASLTNRLPGEIQWVCAYQVPLGWVVLDMITNYSQCGGGLHNVWQIENLNGMAVGSQVTCCNEGANPTGWVITNYSTNYGKCGGNAQNNVKTIRKISRQYRGSKKS